MLTLAETKLHLRVDHGAEDAAITAMIAAAEASVREYLNAETLPDEPPVRAACLMLVGSLYMCRETVDSATVGEGKLFERLLAPYRAMSV
jgi:hypothetical protein